MVFKGLQRCTFLHIDIVLMVPVYGIIPSFKPYTCCYFNTLYQVEDIWVVKNKVTNENKGIAYIKYAKASEAAAAMEKLHGTTIGDNPKPIKV